MENTEEPCIICFEENKEKILFDCTHSICLFCYSKLLEKENAVCPICRKSLDKQFEPMNISIPIPNIPAVEIPNNRLSLDYMRCLAFVFVLVGIVVLVLAMITKY
jgi:hypothetical protein